LGDALVPETSARAAELLAEIEQIYRSVPIGLCLVDRNMRFLRVNSLLASINGRPVHEHLGRSISEVIPEIADHVTSRYREVFRTGRPMVDVTVRACLPSEPGFERSWLVSDHPIAAPDGSIESILTLVREADPDPSSDGRAISGSEAVADLIDRLPVGVILTTARSKVLRANAEAHRILERNEALNDGPDGLCAAKPRVSRRLRELIARAADDPAMACEAIQLPQSERVPLAAVVSRFRGLAAEGSSGGVAMVIVSDGLGRLSGNVQAVESMYGLTPSESSIAVQLAHGLSLKEVAEKRGIRIGTARTHLKRALEKTGTHRQSELVRLLLTGPTLLLPD
jgi:PAS domain S-box-containing protein